MQQYILVEKGTGLKDTSSSPLSSRMLLPICLSCKTRFSALYVRSSSSRPRKVSGIFSPIASEGSNSISYFLIVEVLKIANDVAYGLGANVFTENTGCAMRMAHALEAGSVWVRFLSLAATSRVAKLYFR